ncbi:MAG: sulfate permease [Clostridia bacterium]|nr:sulfate permease [Clostridia bacterium]MBQ8743494.1 sulfate permease [Clostridia bacterium]
MNKIFRPKIIDSMKGYTVKQLASDLVAGLIVAIIALPLSIALAIASGVSPEKGIYTAIVAGFVISLLGGSRVNISGPTAAFATIVAGVVARSGIEGLVIATLMAGLILIIMGLLRFGSLIKYIPCTITTGFTSGIAVTIIIGQLKDFMGLTFPAGTHAVETSEKLGAVVRSITTVSPWALLVGAIGLAVLIIWPYISKKIPGSLIAVLVGSLVVALSGIPVNTIGDLYSINGSLPAFSFPGLSLDTVLSLLPDAFTIAILAAIESLLSCVVSDGMIKDKHNSNTELIAQGVGNICSGLFGGIPATGAIARTAANVKNGGRTPISGIVHALVLLLVLVVLMPYASLIPMPIIAAILFVVAYNMSEWREFVHLCKTAPLADVLVLVTTFVLTVAFDLVVAIAVGMVLSIVLFMKRMADNTNIRTWTREGKGRLKGFPENVEVIEIDGPMFFASSDKFTNITFEENTRAAVFRMHDVIALDATAMKNLFAVLDNCKEKGIRLVVSHVEPQPLAAMKRAGFLNALGEENIFDNIDEAISELSKAEKNA